MRPVVEIDGKKYELPSEEEKKKIPITNERKPDGFWDRDIHWDHSAERRWEMISRVYYRPKRIA